MNFSWQSFSTKRTVVLATNLLRPVNIFTDKGFLELEKLGHRYHISITNKEDTSYLSTIRKEDKQSQIHFTKIYKFKTNLLKFIEHTV
jgi:hypothetical protein